MHRPGDGIDDVERVCSPICTCRGDLLDFTARRQTVTRLRTFNLWASRAAVLAVGMLVVMAFIEGVW